MRKGAKIILAVMLVVLLAVVALVVVFLNKKPAKTTEATDTATEANSEDTTEATTEEVTEEVVMGNDLSYEGYNLVWEDNFDAPELNRDDWNVELHEPGWVNEEWQEYLC